MINEIKVSQIFGTLNNFKNRLNTFMGNRLVSLECCKLL